jgi:hypothetical protein
VADPDEQDERELAVVQEGVAARHAFFCRGSRASGEGGEKRARRSETNEAAAVPLARGVGIVETPRTEMSDSPV